MLREAVTTLAPLTGTVAACQALGVARPSYYRTQKTSPPAQPQPRPTPPRALDAAERQAVLGVLHSERFCDAAPAEVYATLLDEGTYLCSERTMYRMLVAEGETRERRNQLVHPAYHKPELLAEAPNQLWSWDIERHEAHLNRAVVKGHRDPPVAAGR